MMIETPNNDNTLPKFSTAQLARQEAALMDRLGGQDAKLQALLRRVQAEYGKLFDEREALATKLDTVRTQLHQSEKLSPDAVFPDAFYTKWLQEALQFIQAEAGGAGTGPKEVASKLLSSNAAEVITEGVSQDAAYGLPPAAPENISAFTGPGQQSYHVRGQPEADLVSQCDVPWRDATGTLHNRPPLAADLVVVRAVNSPPTTEPHGDSQRAVAARRWYQPGDMIFAETSFCSHTEWPHRLLDPETAATLPTLTTMNNIYFGGKLLAYELGVTVEKLISAESCRLYESQKANPNWDLRLIMSVVAIIADIASLARAEGRYEASTVIEGHTHAANTEALLWWASTASDFVAYENLVKGVKTTAESTARSASESYRRKVNFLGAPVEMCESSSLQSLRHMAQLLFAALPPWLCWYPAAADGAYDGPGDDLTAAKAEMAWDTAVTRGPKASGNKGGWRLQQGDAKPGHDDPMMAPYDDSPHHQRCRRVPCALSSVEAYHTERRKTGLDLIPPLPRHCRFSLDDLTQLLLAIRCNAMALRASGAATAAPLSSFAQLGDDANLNGSVLEFWRRTHLASAQSAVHNEAFSSNQQPQHHPRITSLFVLSSLMQHSCAPNCTVVVVDGKLSDQLLPRVEIRALQAIPPGGLLTISYTPSAALIPNGVRTMKYLLPRYCFRCQCSVCSPAVGGRLLPAQGANVSTLMSVSGIDIARTAVLGGTRAVYLADHAGGFRSTANVAEIVGIRGGDVGSASGSPVQFPATSETALRFGAKEEVTAAAVDGTKEAPHSVLARLLIAAGVDEELQRCGYQTQLSSMVTGTSASAAASVLVPHVTHYAVGLRALLCAQQELLPLTAALAKQATPEVTASFEAVVSALSNYVVAYLLCTVDLRAGSDPLRNVAREWISILVPTVVVTNDFPTPLLASIYSSAQWSRLCFVGALLPILEILTVALDTKHRFLRPQQDAATCPWPVLSATYRSLGMQHTAACITAQLLSLGGPDGSTAVPLPSG